MLKAYKYRLYPTNKQSTLINKHIGSCRFVYNLALETKQIAYAGNKVSLTWVDLVNQLPELKNEFHWLKEINSQSLQQSIINLDKGFTAFFKGQNNFPRYKNKHRGNQSFRISQHIKLENDKIFFPKFKEGIKVIIHRATKGTIKQATILRKPTGKYFVSILCDTGERVKPKHKIIENTSIGLDLGISTFLTTSNGEAVENPRLLKQKLSKLKYTQSKYSKFKGNRTRKKLTKLHEKVTNQRTDFLHKTSTTLIRENQTICIEDLNIAGMLKNHNLAQSIQDVSWGTFLNMLNYKAEWDGVNIIKIGRFDPSSKLCSSCGNINKELKLSDRSWICKKCGKQHDRDHNAAINIKNFALRNYLSMGHRLKNQKELPTLVGAMTSETTSL